MAMYLIFNIGIVIADFHQGLYDLLDFEGSKQTARHEKDVISNAFSQIWDLMILN